MRVYNASLETGGEEKMQFRTVNFQPNLVYFFPISFWDEFCLLLISIFFLTRSWLLRHRAGWHLARSSLSDQEKRHFQITWLLDQLDCGEGNIGDFTTCNSRLWLQSTVLFPTTSVFPTELLLFLLFFLWTTKLEDLTEHGNNEYKGRECREGQVDLIFYFSKDA